MLAFSFLQAHYEFNYVVSFVMADYTCKEVDSGSKPTLLGILMKTHMSDGSCWRSLTSQPAGHQMRAAYVVPQTVTKLKTQQPAMIAFWINKTKLHRCNCMCKQETNTLSVTGMCQFYVTVLSIGHKVWIELRLLLSLASSFLFSKHHLNSEGVSYPRHLNSMAAGIS